MTHPLVTQLRFTRSEFQRALNGISDEDARRRIEPMNCISWMIGHVADQEQRYWMRWGQGKLVAPELETLVGFGRPASTPPLADMWAAWHAVVETADPYLDTLTTEKLQTTFVIDGKSVGENIGTLFYRALYHYWYHIGEARAVRQLLGHTDLPEFVGDIGRKGPYRPEGEL